MFERPWPHLRSPGLGRASRLGRRGCDARLGRLGSDSRLGGPGSAVRHNRAGDATGTSRAAPTRHTRTATHAAAIASRACPSGHAGSHTSGHGGRRWSTAGISLGAALTPQLHRSQRCASYHMGRRAGHLHVVPARSRKAAQSRRTTDCTPASRMIRAGYRPTAEERRPFPAHTIGNTPVMRLHELHAYTCSHPSAVTPSTHVLRAVCAAARIKRIKRE